MLADQPGRGGVHGCEVQAARVPERVVPAQRVRGGGVVEAEFKGHYLILTWAEYTSGKAPSTTAQDQALEQFEADLVAGSANIALSERMVHGAPATTS